MAVNTAILDRCVRQEPGLVSCTKALIGANWIDAEVLSWLMRQPDTARVVLRYREECERASA